MYITSRLIFGFVLGFEVVQVEQEDENSLNIYKIDLGFISINLIPTA